MTGGSGATGGGGEPYIPPSCRALIDACGPNADENCCGSLAVTGGTFYRNNLSQYPATVSDLSLDKFEVTVGRFRGFVATVVDDGWRPEPGAGKHEHLNDGALVTTAGDLEPGWNSAWNEHLLESYAAWDAMTESCDSGYRTWTNEPGGNNELRPINCINWYQAYAFCIWDDGFLPSEAEWNYAAVGGDRQLPYPWHDEPCQDCVEVSVEPYRRHRGGGFNTPMEHLHPWGRGADHAEHRHPNHGVRCARSPRP